VRYAIQVNYNWHATDNPHYGSNGCDFESFEVGLGGCKSIEYYGSCDGSTHYCDIVFDNGRSIRIFNLNEVLFENK